MTYDYPYLKAFLANREEPREVPRPRAESGAPRADKTDRSHDNALLSALSVRREVLAGESLPLESKGAILSVAAACDGCGRATWLALVGDDGTRTCVDCLTGRTAMRSRGVPI